MTERVSQWRKGCSHSDGQALCQSDVIATWLRHCQRPCPLRRSAPALPKGEPLPKRRSLAEYPKPLPLGATATTAASGGNRESLLGPRPAGCERERSRRWEPQPGLGAERLRGLGRWQRSTGAATASLCQRDSLSLRGGSRETGLPSPSLLRNATSPKGRAFAKGKLHILLSPITHPMMNIGINLL